MSRFKTTPEVNSPILVDGREAVIHKLSQDRISFHFVGEKALFWLSRDTQNNIWEMIIDNRKCFAHNVISSPYMHN